MGYTKTCFNSLPSTSTHSYSIATHCHQPPLIFNLLSLIFSPPPPIPTHGQPTPTHFKPTLAHVQPLSPISSPHPNTLTQFKPSPAIPTHIQSLCFTCPRALRIYVLMGLRVSCVHVIHFSVFYCISLYPLRAFVCVNKSRLFIYTAFFSQCLFSFHGFSAHVFQCFHLFDVARTQTYLGPKKRIFSKFP